MKYFFTITLILFSSITFADQLSSEAATREFSDKVMALFIQKKFDEGLTEAKKYWPLPPVEIDGLANQIKQQWPIVDQRFGAPTGTEFVKTEKIADSFVRHFYLHKFVNHAIYWRFDFYKPKDTWVINSIVFLDTIDALYE